MKKVYIYPEDRHEYPRNTRVYQYHVCWLDFYGFTSWSVTVFALLKDAKAFAIEQYKRQRAYKFIPEPYIVQTVSFLHEWPEQETLELLTDTTHFIAPIRYIKFKIGRK